MVAGLAGEIFIYSDLNTCQIECISTGCRGFSVMRSTLEIKLGFITPHLEAQVGWQESCPDVQLSGASLSELIHSLLGKKQTSARVALCVLTAPVPGSSKDLWCFVW